MAKKERVPPDAQSLRAAVARFTKQADRGAALVAAAWVDDALEARLRAAIKPDKKMVDDLFRADGLLGSFSARTKLAYLLDLIEAAERRDLDIIRGIRNDFAHSRGDLRFTERSIRGGLLSWELLICGARR
jgi:DNA-binding MltR family transcriptional regulator